MADAMQGGVINGWVLVDRYTDADSGKQVKLFYKKWTGAAISGRPKWVSKLSINCIFSKRGLATKTIDNTSYAGVAVNPTVHRVTIQVEEPEV